MSHEVLFALLILGPILSGILSRFARTIWMTLRIAILGALIPAIFGVVAIRRTFAANRIFAFSDWLFLDSLSAYHLAVMLIVFTLSSLFALVYFGEEIREKRLNLSQIRTFAGFWGPSLSAMILVLISNNLGMMWVGMEATTLLTSFLILIHLSRESLEAMWKYMLICSVGIGFAFLGTLLIRLSAKDLPLDPNQALLWTNLMLNTKFLDVSLVRAAFIFILVGYGTKAGLAPMHNWLPDAHSKAPAPVSAVFSGFMLNAALYCIMRYMPIVEGVTGDQGWTLRLLSGFGLFSILISSAFILFQHDIKRLLAYHSVEHLGIITLGLGLGGVGTFAALFHTFNHSLCKALSFFAAGRLGQIFGSHDMERMGGSCRVSPVWGWGIFGSILALIGVVPFSLFMSEFQILKAAVDGGRILIVLLFLFGTGAVFIGALGHILPLAFGEPHEPVVPRVATPLETFLVVVPLMVLLLLGIWMPRSFRNVLNRATAVIHHTQDPVRDVATLGGSK
jgi:hydrogenase-4 component F